MSRFLVDEMFPPAAARLLREQSGHDAMHVSEIGLRGADDATVASLARAEGRVLVTENVAHFAAEGDLVLVLILKKNLPAGRGQSKGLAVILDRWTIAHPDPYRGHQWQRNGSSHISSGPTTLLNSSDASMLQT